MQEARSGRPSPVIQGRPAGTSGMEEGGRMRKSVLLVLSGIGLFAIAGTASAQGDWVVRTQVPFTFEVGDTTLPAGSYTIEPLGIMEPSVFVIRSADDRSAVEFLANDTTPQGRPTSAGLTFDRYGNKEFLRAIHVPGSGAVELPVSSSQRGVENEAAVAAERHGLAAEHDSPKKVGSER
jgi:hypothetical protein